MTRIAREAATMRRGNGKGKLHLLTRQSLDGRTRAARLFDSIASNIASDLAGLDQMSTIQRHLVEAFAGIAVHVHDLNTRMLMGETVELAEHAQAVTTLVRVASRLPINRIAKDITPSLSEYLRQNYSSSDDDEREAAE